MKLFKTYFIIVFCTLIFSFFAFAIYKIGIEKRLYPYPKEVIKEYEENTGKTFDNRPRFKVYGNLLENNKEVTVSIPPESFLINTNYKIKNNIFPLSGISETLTINCNENGYYSIYKSDRYGFNNPDEEWDKENIEYLLLGDSFVHGFCVDRPNDIASVLRNLSNKSVLNLGYAGNGPLIEYAVLKEYIKPNIKNIIWFYYEGNDIKNLRNEHNSKILSKYIEDYNFTQNLKRRQKDINLTMNDYLDYHYNKIIRLYLSLKEITKSLINKKNNKKKTKDKEKLIKYFSDILSYTKKISLENNSKLYFVYLPEISRYKNEDYQNNLYIEIKSVVEELGIPFIDIDKKVFEKEDDPLKLFPFKVFPHYTIEGYDKISKSIFKFISK